MKKFFITGVYRSGTTLLERLINTDLSVSVLDQPCAPLFFHAKKKIYSKFGLNKSLPIDPSFPDPGFNWESMYELLGSELFTKEDLLKVFNEIKSYHGIRTAEVGQLAGRVTEGNFLLVYSQILDLLNEEKKLIQEAKRFYAKSLLLILLRMV